MNALSAIPPARRPSGYVRTPRMSDSPDELPGGFPPTFAARLAELKGAFMQQLPARFDALEAALARGELEGCIDQAHRLRGTAGSYGLAAVTRETGRLEDALCALRAEGIPLEGEALERLQRMLEAARRAAEVQP